MESSIVIDVLVRNTGYVALIVLGVLVVLWAFTGLFDLLGKKHQRSPRKPQFRASRAGKRQRLKLPGDLQTNVTALQSSSPLYRQAGLIGSGGFADVFLGIGPSGERVAIKRLRATKGPNGELSLKLFRREAYLLSRIDSKVIPRLISQHMDGPDPYFIMEYIDGPDLATLVRTKGPLKGSTILQLLLHTSLALDELHIRGFVHRDIKPSNVIVSYDDVKLIDLGIGKDISSQATLTQAQLGTLAFSAPESLMPGNYLPASDVFSWAATVGFAATGKSPYGSASQGLVSRILHGEFDPGFLEAVKALGKEGETGRKLVALLLQSLQKEPAKRPPDGMKLFRQVGDVIEAARRESQARVKE